MFILTHDSNRLHDSDQLHDSHQLETGSKGLYDQNTELPPTRPILFCLFPSYRPSLSSHRIRALARVLFKFPAARNLVVLAP